MTEDRVDILFVHPGNQAATYQDLAREFTAIATPAWTLLLAQHARRAGLRVAFYDAAARGWDQTVARELLATHRPRLIVVMVYGHNPSASTQTMPAARRVAADLKSGAPGAALAFGGTHPSALPARTLDEEPIDYVIQGEGPHTVVGLTHHLRGEGAVERVPGLWYRADGAARFTFAAPLVSDPDRDLNGYAWDLLPSLDPYRAHNMHCFQEFERSARDDFADVRSPYVAMNTSLGCPFSCSYCCINAVFGKPGVRYWSVPTVLAWIDELHCTYHVRNIRLDDELFLLAPARVEALCNGLIARGYDLNLWAYGRVDTVHAGLLAKLRHAGFRWICLGIEAGNEQVRRDVNKKIRADIRAVVQAIRDAGIYVLGNYMFGLPEDTAATMQETLDLAIELNTEFANFYSVMAYPGSHLYAAALAHPEALPPDWGAYSQHAYRTRPLPTRHLSAAEVLAFRDAAFTLYHTRPEYLDMMNRTFGPRVVAHLRRMVAVPVRRQLTEQA